MNDARHGVIVDRRPTGGGLTGTVGAFIVQDEADDRYYTFAYTQIVTEGFSPRIPSLEPVLML